MVEVVNIRFCKDFGTIIGDVRIDRYTKWGNPFHLQYESITARDQVINQYIAWFIQQELDGKLDIRELLSAKRLGCWCKPKACHGDYLKERIEELLQNNKRCFYDTRPII